MESIRRFNQSWKAGDSSHSYVQGTADKTAIAQVKTIDDDDCRSRPVYPVKLISVKKDERRIQFPAVYLMNGGGVENKSCMPTVAGTNRLNMDE